MAPGRLGPFVLDAPLERGGMAVVWAATHVDSGTPVAIKVLDRDAAHDQHRILALEREIRATAALDHPGVIWVFDAGRVPAEVAEAHPELGEGLPWLAMELARGGTLQHRLRALSWPEIESIVLDLLDALAHAHARGLLHRDLKPSNILFRTPTSERPVLADFGMAHSTGEASTPGGTPAWMAPEQLLDDVAGQGPWTDLYALGCILHEMMTGRPPYTAATPFGVLDQHRGAPIPPAPETYSRGLA
ncbi:MAG: serine/threonine protein kinase, partial [Myxococcales bacterium]|nr:serine/threonine protein kinase [Myxococcales bacterium]